MGDRTSDRHEQGGDPPAAGMSTFGYRRSAGRCTPGLHDVTARGQGWGRCR